MILSSFLSRYGEPTGRRSSSRTSSAGGYPGSRRTVFPHVFARLRYWVLAVVPYLLWAFCANHSLETCKRIYRVCLHPVQLLPASNSDAPNYLWRFDRFLCPWLYGTKLQPSAFFSFAPTRSSIGADLFWYSSFRHSQVWSPINYG